MGPGFAVSGIARLEFQVGADFGAAHSVGGREDFEGEAADREFGEERRDAFRRWRTKEPGGTSSFVIVDGRGNVVSMTTTVNYPFGDGRMVDGFFINNQLNDFSSVAVDGAGKAIANAVGPGKRPRSSMAPAIILDGDRRFVMAVGSPGGLAIPAYILKTMVGVLDWHLSMQDAIDLPNLIALGANFIGETGKFSPELLQGLAGLGVPVKEGFGAEDSGIQGIIVRPDHLEGGADPRREGVAKTCC